jgi:FKBP-type peptidyl-prolyl cis-trans isomerase
MKKIVACALAFMMVTAVSTQSFAQKWKKNKEKKENQTATVALPAFASNNDTVSYIIGADIAHSFIKNGIDLNTEMVFKGFRDAQAKVDTAFSQEQIGNIMMEWQQRMSAKKDAESAAVCSGNIKKGDEFLATNRTKEGVIETASGLQYKILKDGTGESPDDNDMVEVHYTGTLIDGTVFDSSRDRGEPIEFPVNGVIAGWTEALKLMKTGSRFMLYIPSKLAYGDRATGPIPEGSTLIFDVELLEFERK